MVSVLFGAGASRNFFKPTLTTQYLTEAVKDPNNWNRVIKHYRAIKGPSIVIAEPTEVVGLINLILGTNPDFNFEQIAEVLDKLCSYWFDSLPMNTMLGALEFIFKKIYSGDVPWAMCSGWDDIPFLFRQVITEAILDLQHNHKSLDYTALLSNQKTFIESLSKSDNDISLISLNYDETLANSIEGLGFDTCFQESKLPGQFNEIDINKFFNCKKVIYYPHGHVRFRFTDQLNVEYYRNGNFANHQRWVGLDSAMPGANMPITKGKFSYNFNSFITIGQTKDDILNYLPYSVYYQRMAIDLFKSDKLFIIGYSFGDDHINRFLKSYLKSGQNKKVIIVDYYNKPITMIDEYRDSENFILKIYNVFGPEWRVNINSNGQKVAWDVNEIATLNSSGFGKIFSQVYFYKKGYTEFLKDWINERITI